MLSKTNQTQEGEFYFLFPITEVTKTAKLIETVEQSLPEAGRKGRRNYWTVDGFNYTSKV